MWIEYVLMGLINLTNIFDPDSIVLSGAWQNSLTLRI